MTKLNKTDASLMIGLSRITNFLQHEISILCSKHDLTQTQFAILEVLYSKGELLVGEIQKLILSTPGNVPYVINNLINKGLVTKLNVESDKRCSKICLTPAGKDKILEILPAHVAKVTSNLDIQIELASDVGLDIVAFIKAIQSGEAEKKFNADMAMTYSTGINGFPSFLVKTSEGRQILVRGYKTFAEFQEIISHLTDGSLKATVVTPSLEALTELLGKH
jgi:MarR family 2-MHQ and catechol resistance regulon transcriptional repressor